MAAYEVIDRCRSCRGRNLVDILSLGEMPLADALVTEDRLAGPEDAYPLTVTFCEDCSLVQIRETVPPSTLFGEDYPYYSSFSETLLEHSRRNVEALVADLELGPDDLAVEIASNDGYLLQYFARPRRPRPTTSNPSLSKQATASNWTTRWPSPAAAPMHSNRSPSCWPTTEWRWWRSPT